jgi:hypothetical protein
MKRLATLLPVLAVVGYLAPAAVAAPCPAEIPSGWAYPPAEPTDLIAMTTPSTAPAGRRFVVRLSEPRYSPNIRATRIRLEAVDSQGQPLMTVDMPAGRIEGGGGLWLVPMPQGSGPVTVRLSYTVDTSFTSYGQPSCERTSTASVAPIRGEAPRVRLSSGLTAMVVRIERPRSCEMTAVMPVRIAIRGGGRRSTYEIPDVCGESTTRKGWIDEADVYRYGPRPKRLSLWSAYPRLEFRPAKPRRSYRQTYRVRASVGGRVVANRRLVVSYRYYPAERVWAGTDRFFNYCLNGGKKLRSSGGRLYCVEPSVRDFLVRLRR